MTVVCPSGKVSPYLSPEVEGELTGTVPSTASEAVMEEEKTTLAPEAPVAFTVRSGLGKMSSPLPGSRLAARPPSPGQKFTALADFKAEGGFGLLGYILLSALASWEIWTGSHIVELWSNKPTPLLV